MRKVVSLRDLKIGDILEEDIKDSDEVVLITRGTVLTDRILNRLRRWSMDKDQLITIDDGTEHYNPHNREEIKEKSLKYLKELITSDEEEVKPSIEKLTEMIGIMAQELEGITTIPADVLKIEDAYQGEHYYRVARIAMALASIYNSEVSDDEKVSLQSVGLAAFLHDYGKKFTRASDKNSRLAIIGNECTKLDELSGNNTNKTHNAYAYIALKDKTELDVRKTILFGGFSDSILGNSKDNNATIKSARIIKLADIYDGLLNLISKKNITSPAECVVEYMSEVAEMKDISKELYSLFIAHLPLYVRGTKVLLSNNQYAVVVENSDDPTKPTVLTLTGGAPTLIDLQEREDIVIKKSEISEQKKNSNNRYVHEELRSEYESLSDDDTLLEMLDEDSQKEEKTQMLEEKRPISKRISSLFGVRR